ncbi:MAG TPA: porin, partial [Steroidobacteraceae bacterium]|nr:porin [Steroidobacteraceae bacterium]
MPSIASKYRLIAAFAAVCCSAPSFAVEIAAGEWKFTANGNVNVHYIASSCEDVTTPAVTGGLACLGAAGEENTSSISNGLLPAALAIGASTTQSGYDLAVVFGFYPGISTNDGSPNLQQGATQLNTALGTTGLDIRQVFMTFGNATMGTFLLGRTIGLFGADAILNDMTLPGVGAGNGNYAAPANTSLGSIGLGYIYTDWLAQINYTTRDLNGLKLTIGVFDPLEPLGQALPTPESSPGFHGKVAYTSGPLYLSATFISQKHEGVTDAGDFDSLGFDLGGKFTFGDAELLAWYYQGEGLGTTGLYVLAATPTGGERDSDGFLAQATYKLGNTKLGVNYGESNLDLASGELTSNLVTTNKKFTVGAYHSL